MLGGDGVRTPSARTADQTQIGLFWIESSPLAWNRLARAIAVARGFWPWENGGEPAALFAFIFLFFAAAGGGALSLDAWRRRRRA